MTLNFYSATDDATEDRSAHILPWNKCNCLPLKLLHNLISDYFTSAFAASISLNNNFRKEKTVTRFQYRTFNTSKLIFLRTIDHVGIYYQNSTR